MSPDQPLSVLYTAFDVVPSPKGSSTHISQFVKGLVQRQCAVTLITAGDGVLPETGTYLGAQIHRVPPADALYLNRALQFGEAVRIHVLQEPNRYDIAHFRSIWSGIHLVDVQRHAGYRTVFEVNGLPSIELKYHFPDLAGSPTLEKIKQQEAATLLNADHVICPSAVTAAYVASLGVPRDRTTVIPNGIDPELFTPTGAPFSDPAVLLYVGTLARWQGLETLLQALPLVLESRTVQLRIVGKGRKDRQKALLKAVRKAGLEPYVSLEDACSHHTIPNLINQASVCVAPLAFNDRNVTQGCCPLKILEYAACARPIVASNLPVVRELLRDGEEGWLFTPDDPVDLARAVLAALADEPRARQMACAHAARIRAEYTWQSAQKRLLKVYHRLLDGLDGRAGRDVRWPSDPAGGDRSRYWR